MIRVLFICLLVLFKTEAQTSVLNLADSLYARGNYSKAIVYYKTYKHQQQVFHKIAKSYIAVGNYDAALKSYETFVNADTSEVLNRFDYGKLLAKTKKHKTAVTVFNDLINIDKENPNYHYELGLILEKLKDSTAYNYFYNAYQLDKTHQKAIYRLAKHCIKKGENTLADTFISQGLATYANNKELINLRAQNLYLKKRYKEAIVWFEKLLALNESSEFIHEKLSVSYAEEMAYEKAIEHMLVALEFNENNTNNLFKLASFYQNIYDYNEAEKIIIKALKILDTPLDKEYMMLGTVLNRQKKFKEAISAYKKAVKEAPYNERANFFLVFTKDQYYKDYDTRIKLYEGFKKKFPKGNFIQMADHRISELKKEKFLNAD